MAKAKKPTKAAPKKEAPKVAAKAEKPKAQEVKEPLTKEQAREIVDNHSGINGIFIPDNLKEAKEALRTKRNT